METHLASYQTKSFARSWSRWEKCEIENDVIIVENNDHHCLTQQHYKYNRMKITVEYFMLSSGGYQFHILRWCNTRPSCILLNISFSLFLVWYPLVSNITFKYGNKFINSTGQKHSLEWIFANSRLPKLRQILRSTKVNVKMCQFTDNNSKHDEFCSECGPHWFSRS